MGADPVVQVETILVELQHGGCSGTAFSGHKSRSMPPEYVDRAFGKASAWLVELSEVHCAGASELCR